MTCMTIQKTLMCLICSEEKKLEALYAYFFNRKNGEAPCAYFSYGLIFFEVQRVHALIFHVLLKKSVFRVDLLSVSQIQKTFSLFYTV